ncbi:biotin--[acetyl-CoA-carboxylase] ligase [Cellulosimicrobium cellulans]|uniref:biotin--[acetyl-CoA-carboxylase] ligase n=1 Tax=Cellulosimicrobium cellulans TaxID=1710 RepID=UPI00240630FE|nr:biotin--[acetyl-CoA-carboxylase] ligase [Cellulosimicrobium cellulans]MDF9875718.1 BirA family biotin operon repressor/biotin-[acetyl-CoA-carboxylase] ligase [Cellulosimicrobium cellulans]
MASTREDETRPDGEGRPPLRAEFLRELLVTPAGPLARLEVVPESASTNAELARAVAADPGAWPAPALLVAEHQPAGRGRLGRSWTTPPRAALLGSLLLRPDVPRETLSWLPLLAGLATTRALRATAGVDAVVKWPNDVLVPDPGAGASAPLRKVAGILAEVLPDGGVVVGVGLNVSQRRDELPVPTATSLALAGAATTDREIVLVALHEAFGEVLVRWQDAGGDAHAAGLDADCAEVSATLGTRVRVERVGGGDVVGLATGLALDGGLVVREDDGTTSVHRSGDVHHLRPHD